MLTDAAAAQIQSVARLLWALKRAEHSLSAAWLLLNTTQRTLSRLTAKAKKAHLPCTGDPLRLVQHALQGHTENRKQHNKLDSGLTHVRMPIWLSGVRSPM